MSCTLWPGHPSTFSQFSSNSASPTRRFRCHNLSKAAYLSEMPLATSGYLVALPANQELVTNISTAVSHVTFQPAYNLLLDESLSIRRSCPSQPSGTEAVSASSMIGLFLVLAALMLVATFMSFLRAWRRNPTVSLERRLTRGPTLAKTPPVDEPLTCNYSSNRLYDDVQK